MSQSILISLTGPFAIRTGRAREHLHLTGNTLRLITQLAGNYNTELRRESLTADVWPEADPVSANASLNTALWRIRKCLTRFEGLQLSSFEDVVLFEVSSPARVDVAMLENAMADVAHGDDAEALLPERRQQLADAVAFYRGDFLEGSSELWVLAKREHYTALQIRALCMLMRDAAAQNWIEAALNYGRAILALDPFREGSLRELMLLYVRNGERAKALRQYEALRSLLRTELGIEPMEETTSLFRQISEIDPAPGGVNGGLPPNRQAFKRKDFQHGI
jgi:DNA-binding SARP family transcriptional activator